MYATPDHMRAEFGEGVLVQLTGAAAWDATAIAGVTVKLERASALADSYIGRRHKPAAGIAVPPSLIYAVCDIAYADLHRAPPEETAKRKADAIAWLKDVAAGRAVLDEGNAEAIPARDGQVIVPERDRTFSRDSMAGF